MLHEQRKGPWVLLERRAQHPRELVGTDVHDNLSNCPIANWIIVGALMGMDEIDDEYFRGELDSHGDEAATARPG